MSGDREFVKATGVLAAAPFSAAIRDGDTIFVSGQVGLDADGKVVPGVGDQTRAALRAIKDILEGLGSSMADVVQVRVFITDFATYADYNEAYREFFAEPYPTRATLGTSELALGAGVEIEAVAIRRQNDG
jgi:2-iminobutanoate/2-iminopropanoate deaminase